MNEAILVTAAIFYAWGHAAGYAWRSLDKGSPAFWIRSLATVLIHLSLPLALLGVWWP